MPEIEREREEADTHTHVVVSTSGRALSGIFAHAFGAKTLSQQPRSRLQMRREKKPEEGRMKIVVTRTAKDGSKDGWMTEKGFQIPQASRRLKGSLCLGNFAF